MLDLVIANVRLAGRTGTFDIGIAGGLIAEIATAIAAPAPRQHADGALACGGFVEPHIHLDKADILDRCPICEGTLQEAIALTAAAKTGFTVDDVRSRASRIVERAIMHGTTRMRSFVEVDPRAGFRSFEALLEVRRDYAWGIDIELCAFAQDGLTQEPETLGLIEYALANGADLVGGCPYTDVDPVAHVSLIFDLAEKHGTAVDFHADFDLDPQRSILPEIARQTRERGFTGRVSIGHATKLSAMEPTEVDRIGALLAEADISVSALPATDQFLLGRHSDRLIPRGVAPLMRLRQLGVNVSLGCNNILNPFTPSGDASLLHIASLFASVAQLSRDADVAAAFEMITSAAATQLGATYGLAIGKAADIVLVDAPDPATAVRTNAAVLAGWKRGRASFVRSRPTLFAPEKT